MKEVYSRNVGTSMKNKHNISKYYNIELLKSVDDDMKTKYRDTIKRAQARIESGYEQALFNKNSAVGAIFTLKNNYNWVDKQEIVQENRDIKVELTD